jgi:hypothetical protein
MLPRARIAAGLEVADGPRFTAFREVPRTGVIFVTTEARGDLHLDERGVPTDGDLRSRPRRDHRSAAYTRKQSEE